MLQCVAVCCSVLQCVAVCCSVVLQHLVAMSSISACCSHSLCLSRRILLMLQCVAVCCSVLKCDVAVCHCNMMCCSVLLSQPLPVLPYIAYMQCIVVGCCCVLLQCVVLPCVALMVSLAARHAWTCVLLHLYR